MEYLDQFVKKILKIYPHHLRIFLQSSTFVVKQRRFNQGERIDGSYDIETGEIILWEPDLNDEEGLILIITHELGHKIYHEWLERAEVEEWLIVRSLETIDLGLMQSYSAIKRPEEEFCTLFSLASLAKYWDKNKMKAQSKKLTKKLKKTFPIATNTIEKCISKNKHSKKSSHDITHREVQHLKEWIHRVID